MRSSEFVAAIPGFQDSTVREADLIRRNTFEYAAFENQACTCCGSSRDFGTERFESHSPKIPSPLAIDSSNLVRSAWSSTGRARERGHTEIAKKAALEQKPGKGRARALQLIWEFGGDAMQKLCPRSRRSGHGAKCSQDRGRVTCACLSRVQSKLLNPSYTRFQDDVTVPLEGDSLDALREIFRQNNESVRQRRGKKLRRKWKKNWTGDYVGRN